MRGVWRSFKYPSVTLRTAQAMGEKVPSSAPLPATPHFPLPITSYKLKIERDCETTPKEETNSLDTDESIVLEPAEVFDKLEPERDFILMFESLPVLWDPNHPYYTNKYKRYKFYLDTHNFVK